jgi:hypothetical protein
VAEIYNYSTRVYSYCWNSNGAGTSVNCNRDFPEGIQISFRACTGEGSTGRLVSCGPWVVANTTN